MKKILSFVLLVCVAMSLASCSLFSEKVIPAAKKSASEKITMAIVKTGECKNVEQVQADVNELLKVESDEGMVAKAIGSEAPAGSQQEGIVSQICKSAASLALPTLLQKGVPDKWECTLTDLGGKIGDLADMACGKIDF